MANNAPFPIHPHLTAIAIAYRNKAFIADAVLPRTPVGKKEFQYLVHTLGDAFTVPDTKVGRKSAPNQVDFSASELTSATIDYGLDDPIPQDDIDNAPANYDPLGRAVEGTTNLIELDREIRAAALVFAAGTYASGKKVQLSGTAQWDDTAAAPITDINTGLEATLDRPNVMVIGQIAWNALRTHADILKAVNHNDGDKGLASRQQVADLFELEEVLVGSGWLNSAKRGQAVTMARVWGGHCALLHRNRLADTRGGATFGLTAQFGSRISGTRPDPNIGAKGGQMVRVVESVKELVTAQDLGYFIQDAV